jgi:hypothetical protein
VLRQCFGRVVISFRAVSGLCTIPGFLYGVVSTSRSRLRVSCWLSLLLCVLARFEVVCGLCPLLMMILWTA